MIQDLSTVSVDHIVSIIGKIIKVASVESINTRKGKKLLKQDCVLKDTTSVCRIVLWEDNVDKLAANKSYKLENVIVKQYDGVKYLSLAAGDSKPEEIPEIDGISDDEGLIEPEREELSIMSVTGEIVAIQSISDYLSCLNCSGGTVHSINAVIGKCSKCDAMLKLSKCDQSQSARFVVMSGDGKKFNLLAYKDQLESLFEGQDNSLTIEFHIFLSLTISV